MDKHMLKKFFTPDDVALMKHFEKQSHLYRNDCQEMSMDACQRLNLFDSVDLVRSAIGSHITSFILKLIEDEFDINGIINALFKDEDVARFLQNVRGIEGNTNMGGISILLTPLFWKKREGRYFVIRDQLNEKLHHANVGSKAPALLFRAPYPTTYVAFGTKREHLCDEAKMYNTLSGDHVCEGVYIHQYQSDLVEGHISTSTIAGLSLDRNKSVRVLHLLFTGSPIGKENIFDDNILEITLFIQNEDLSVEEIIHQHFEYYFNLSKYADLGEQGFPVTIHSRDMGKDEATFFMWAITHLAKVLLYINSDQCIREVCEDRTRLLDKIQRVAPKKRGKLERQLPKTSNAIYIGSKTTDWEWSEHAKRGLLNAHWRRGHFRAQRYGEALSKVKSIWIEPTLVGSNEQVSTKPYVVG